MEQKFKELVEMVAAAFSTDDKVTVEETPRHWERRMVSRIPIGEGLELLLALTKNDKIQVQTVRVRINYLGEEVRGTHIPVDFKEANLTATRPNDALFKAISKYMENNEGEREQFKTLLQHHKDYVSNQIQRLKRQEWALNLEPTPDEGIIAKYPSETRNRTVEVTRQIKDGPRVSLGGQSTLIIEDLPMKLVRKIVDLIEQEYGEN